MSLRERAVAVKLDLCYDENYRILCGFKHTGSAAAGFIFGSNGDAFTVVAPGPAVQRTRLGRWLWCCH